MPQPDAASHQGAAPKVALVTGAARGNGLAIAHALAAAGATVYLADIAADLPAISYSLATPRDLYAAAAEVRKHHGRAEALLCDVRDPAAVDEAVAAIERAAGPVEILVNNAGVMALHALHEVTDEEWDVQLDVIAKGAFLCCRRVLPGMNAKGWGRIVNVASVAGHRGLGTGVAYTAAKHALVGLTRALAMEVANQNITVNAVCPGTTPTDLVRGVGQAAGLAEDEALLRFSARHLTGRPIRSEDIAAAVAWLASDGAARVNGASLFVDDGWHAH
jgi:NAD(P)-dependent dehydrogenase (short-subunit alcohol dehydrogenase family)